MGHYLSEMVGDGELTPEQQASLDNLKLSHEREKALREARAVGMVAAIEHLVRHSPLPVDLEFVQRHLGLDGRGPESAAVSEAIGRLMSRREDRMQLSASQTLILPRAKASR